MNITDEYNDTLTTNINDNYRDTLSSNCTNNEVNNDLLLPTFLLTITCGLSYLCLMSLMIYTLIKHLFNCKGMEKFFLPKSSSSLENQYF